MNRSVSRDAGATGGESCPLVTSIVVTRNKESHIDECLSGLLQQSVADKLEIVVVDQGSEESETSVVTDFQRRFRNVISLRIPRAEGKYAGVGLAVKIATGKYLTILDAADRMGTDAYELLSAALERDPAAHLAYGDTCFTTIPHQTLASNTSYGKMIWPDYTPQQLARLTEVAPHPMWRRDLHYSIGGFGEGDDALRDLMQAAIGCSPLLHITAVTGLKLVETATPREKDAAGHDHPTKAHAASTAPAGQAVLLQGERELTAEEDFRLIHPLAHGEDLLQAAEALEKHLARYPEHAVAHNDLGATSYRLGDKEKALKHYRLAVQLSPEESTYRKNLADMLYVEEGEVDEAIAIYLDLLDKSPRDVETLLNLGIISEDVGRPAEAESFYQRALEIEPWNPEVRENLSALRKRQGAESFTDEDDEPAEERYEMVQTLVAQGDVEAATAELERILTAYPDFPPAHNDLAVLYHQRGDKAEALAHYEKAAALVPGNGTYQKNLADFYFVEGHDVDGAIAIYLDQLKKEPKNIDTLMNLGKICTLLDRPQEAESFYGKVTQLEPWNQAARECLTNLRRCANG